MALPGASERGGPTGAQWRVGERRLEAVPPRELEELIVEVWLCRAPKRLADAYLAENPTE